MPVKVAEQQDVWHSLSFVSSLPFVRAAGPLWCEWLHWWMLLFFFYSLFFYKDPYCAGWGLKVKQAVFCSYLHVYRLECRVHTRPHARRWKTATPLSLQPLTIAACWVEFSHRKNSFSQHAGGALWMRWWCTSVGEPWKNLLNKFCSFHGVNSTFRPGFPSLFGFCWCHSSGYYLNSGLASYVHYLTKLLRLLKPFSRLSHKLQWAEFYWTFMYKCGVYLYPAFLTHYAEPPFAGITTSLYWISCIFFFFKTKICQNCSSFKLSCIVISDLLCSLLCLFTCICTEIKLYTSQLLNFGTDQWDCWDSFIIDSLGFHLSRAWVSFMEYICILF